MDETCPLCTGGRGGAGDLQHAVRRRVHEPPRVVREVGTRGHEQALGARLVRALRLAARLRATRFRRAVPGSAHYLDLSGAARAVSGRAGAVRVGRRRTWRVTVPPVAASRSNPSRVVAPGTEDDSMLTTCIAPAP